MEHYAHHVIDITTTPAYPDGGNAADQMDGIHEIQDAAEDVEENDSGNDQTSFQIDRSRFPPQQCRLVTIETDHHNEPSYHEAD